MIVVCKASEKEDYILFKLREDGVVKFKNVPFKNYFYIKNEDADTALFLCKGMISNIDNFDEVYSKVFFKKNFWRNKVKNTLIDGGISTFEADIGSVKRFFINNQGIDLNHRYLKHCFMDIETYDMAPLETDKYNKVIASAPILSVAFEDFDENITFIRNKGLDKEVTFIKRIFDLIEADKEEEARIILKENEHTILKLLHEGELELLKEYFEVAKKYDSMIAYNGKNFDFTYINQRMNECGMNYYDMMLVDLDYMVMYKKDSWANYKSFSLNNVAFEEFKGELSKEASQYKNLDEVTKLDWKSNTNCKKYFELFLCYPKMLEEYNVQDVKLMLMIENKVKFLQIHNTQSELIHCPIDDTITSSRMCDYMLLNEKFKNGIVSKTKPSDFEVELRKKTIPSGGYTFSFYPGVWDNVKCFDFHSHYPTVVIDFNISSEMYAGNQQPDLSTVFDSEEMSFIEFCCSSAEQFIDKKNELNKKKYNKFLEEERLTRGLSYTMNDLMWKFVREYNMDHLQDYIKSEDVVVTPADINYDTRGWKIHPHRFFKRTSFGLASKICYEILTKRDEVKAEQKKFKKYSDEWWSLEAYQLALKLNINSLYGFFGYRLSRDYFYEIPDSITTSARFITKTTMVRGKELNQIPIWGDTDSTYAIDVGDTKKTIDELNCFYYDLFKDWFKQFNTCCKVTLPNPHISEVEGSIHITSFDFEKGITRAIVMRKKRYFYKDAKDGKFKCKGAAMLKSDTLKIAADLQEELARSVLDDTFDKDVWHDKILNLKVDVYNMELSGENLFKHVTLTKSIGDYGKPTIDGKTGRPKIKKDGSIQMSPIPCHIKVAKKIIDSGKLIDVGDKIGYVIINNKPRNEAVSIDEYNVNKTYCAPYYWERIESALLEVLEVIIFNDVYDSFSDCWSMSSRVQERLKRELVERFSTYDKSEYFKNPMRVSNK